MPTVGPSPAPTVRPSAFRERPPPGRSPEYFGTVSAPSTARATSVTAPTTGAGRSFAPESATEPIRVTGPQPVAAAFQPAAATGAASVRRMRLTSAPVLIWTGHAVWHIPSTAQVCTPA